MAESLGTFHPFTRLPTEIQDEIWQYAIEAIPSRVVNLLDRHTSPCPIPAVLHACQQSRELASRRWRLAFALPPHSSSAGLRSHDCAKVFFDFARDILWVGNKLDCFFLYKEDRDALRNIAFDIDDVLEGIDKLLGRPNGYYRQGRIMAREIHQFLPFLERMVGCHFFPDEDPEANIFQLVERPRGDRARTLDIYWGEFGRLYEERGWARPPKVTIMDCITHESGAEEFFKPWDEYPLDFHF